MFARTSLGPQMPPWKPGQSGNPAGRPKGSANFLAEAFKADLLAEWKRRGLEVLKKLKPNELARPARYCWPPQCHSGSAFKREVWL